MVIEVGLVAARLMTHCGKELEGEIKKGGEECRAGIGERTAEG